MGVDRFCCGDNFLVRCVQFSIADIIFDRAAEQEIILRHNTHLSAQTLDRHAFHIDPVDQHSALLHIIKTADQVYDRRFPGAGAPTSDQIVSPWSDIKADVVKHFRVRIVRK